MSYHLRLSPVPGRALLFSLLSAFVAQLSFSQPVAPALSVRQGLPANYDWNQKFLYGGGAYVALTLYPWEFFTSTDGVNWSKITTLPLGDQQLSFANADQIPDYAYGAGHWVVVTDSGKIFSSTDLVNWVRETSGTTVTLHGVNYADSMFLATGDSATLLSSPDGVTWTRRSIATSNPAAESFYHAEFGNKVLTVSSNGNDFTAGYLYSSTHGLKGKWVTDTVGYGTSVVFLKGRFYRNRPNVSYSTDARNWTNLTSGGFFSGAFSDGNNVYFVSDSTIYQGPFPVGIQGTITSSADGVNFGPATLFAADVLYGYYAQGHYFVWARGALESTDANNWAELGSYGPTAAFNGKTYVKVSPTQLGAYISSSPDFIHWTPADTVTTGLNCVVFDSTQFTAFGPTSYVSPNGSNWSVGPSPALDYAAEDFHCIYGGGTFVAWWTESPTNYVWYSHDGVNWGGSTMPPPTPEEYLQGATSAVMEISNIEYINGRFWMLNNSAGGTPAAIFSSTDGSNFSTPAMNNSWSNFNVFSYDQLLYVPDSGKYYIFGLGAQGNGNPVFFTSSTTDPTDSTIVLTNHTTLTGNLTGAYLYNGQNISYGPPNFADPGGFDFAYSNGHFVGGAIGPGGPDPNIPPPGYLLWSSDGSTWDGTSLNAYGKILSNLVSNDTFRIEAWNNIEVIAAYGGTVRRPPDSLLQFNAVALNNKTVLLTWQSSTGGNTREFVIQRSTPNSAWVTLDSVPVSNQDTGTAAYRDIDQSPVKGLNDYRLLIENQDGSSSFSPVRQVQIHGQVRLAVFPNPAHNQVVLMADQVITGGVSLYSEDGKLVQQRYWSGTQLTLPLSGLPTGTYHLVIRSSDGSVDDRNIFHVN
jgi:hypothetical protein